MNDLSEISRPIWQRPPRAVYIHIPFCRRRCGYCNFTLVAGRNDLITPYLDAMSVEARNYELPCAVDTIFIGGGTPSQVRGDDWTRLTKWLHGQFPLIEAGEWSVEVNPEDADDTYLQQLRDSGVTRVSMGVQSFCDAKLKTLEREHTGLQAIDAVRRAVAIFESVGVDLIFAAPGETPDQWRRDLQLAISVGTQHISTYGLTFERGAAFWSRRDLLALDEEIELAMYQASIELLTKEGFEHYEVSNFARLGYRCRHNECYWTGDTYHALGAGASRHLLGRRETNHRSTTQYLRLLKEGKSPVHEVDESSDRDKALETLIFGLRRLDGVNRNWFRQNTGFEIEEVTGGLIAEYCDEGWLADDGRVLQLTSKGLVVSDGLWTGMLKVAGTLRVPLAQVVK